MLRASPKQILFKPLQPRLHVEKSGHLPVVNQGIRAAEAGAGSVIDVELGRLPRADEGYPDPLPLGSRCIAGGTE